MGAVLRRPTPLLPLGVRASQSFVCHIVAIFSDSNMEETPGPEGGTLIFAYICKLGSFFGFKILNFNIFGRFQKNKHFLGV